MTAILPGARRRRGVAGTYDSFTADDLAMILLKCGFAVELAGGSDEEPQLLAFHHGTVTRVRCTNRIAGRPLFKCIILDATVPRPPGFSPKGHDLAAHTNADDARLLELYTLLSFDGGITIDWLRNRLKEWMAVAARCRREAEQVAQFAEQPVARTVH